MRLALVVLLATSLAAMVRAQSPLNDECAGAILVTNGTYGPFNNFSANTSAPAWSCPGHHDVWFEYLAGGTGTLTVDTCGSGLDTVIEIFDGTGGCGASSLLGCNDDAFCAPGSSLSVSVTAGPYYIRVGGYGTGAMGQGLFSLHVNGPAAAAPVARNTMLGVGCGDRYASIYEVFDYLSFDLANTTLTWQLTSTGYTVSRSSGATVVAPTPSATLVAGGTSGQQVFALPSPMPVPGGTVNALNVTTVGQVLLGGAGVSTLVYDPSVAYLLAWPTSMFACWLGLYPAVGNGSVTFEVVGGVAYATWSGVHGGGPPSAGSTFQFQFDLATGDVRLAIVALDILGSPSFPVQPQCVIGYSPGGPNLDPGERDLSGLVGSVVLGPDVPPLRVIGASRPRIGATWDLAVSNIPASAVLGVDVFGASDPGLADLAAIGMPGCGLRASLDVALGWSVAAPLHAYGLSVPNVPALVGQRFYTTTALLTNPPWNAFGMITANAVEGLIGTL